MTIRAFVHRWRCWRSGAATLADAEALLAARTGAWGTRPPPAAWFHYAALASGAAPADLTSAVALLDEGLGHYPHAAVLYSNLAAVQERRGAYGRRGRRGGARIAGRRGIAQLHKIAGDQAYRAAHYDDALDAYQRATRINPSLGE